MRGIFTIFVMALTFALTMQTAFCFECPDVSVLDLRRRLWPKSSAVWRLLQRNNFEVSRWNDGIAVLVSGKDYYPNWVERGNLYPRGTSADIYLHFQDGVLDYAQMRLDYITVRGSDGDPGGILVIVRDSINRVLFVAIPPGHEEGSTSLKRIARALYRSN